MNILKIMVSVLLLIAISIIPVSASLHNVSGYIMEDGTGLSGVTVTDNESIDTTVSNATGYYILNGYTNQTNYILSGSKTGYITNTLEISFFNADLTNQNITIVKTTIIAFLTNLALIVTSITTMFGAVMVVFMGPPLNLFIGVVLFVFVVGIIERYLTKRK